jgi:hypothetical protein
MQSRPKTKHFGGMHGTLNQLGYGKLRGGMGESLQGEVTRPKKHGYVEDKPPEHRFDIVHMLLT